MQSGPDRSPAAPEEGEEEKAPAEGEENEEGQEAAKKPAIDLDAEDTFDTIAAVVRLKIPKVPVEPE